MVSDWLRGQPCLLEELKGIREEEEYEQSEFSLHASYNPSPHLYIQFMNTTNWLTLTASWLHWSNDLTN